MQVAFTRRDLPDPGPPPTPMKTLSRWSLFLGDIAVGTHLADAMKKHYMTRADIETCIRSDPAERQRWADANLAARKRGWSALDFEDIFERIAGGMPPTEAVAKVRGTTAGYSAFNQIVLADAILNEQYLAALKARSLVTQDQILEIADDDKDDVLHGDKGPIANNAAVNRSKLRVETRLRLMAAWHGRMFGEGKNQVQVNVQVNHAGKLEEARARAKSRGEGQPALTQPVIEAAFRELPPVDKSVTTNDFSWLDEPVKEPALDTTWLEG